ncbi:hypothetical protein [Limosilactobacillus vaginalis]|uniref:hypothetical protein n=1 Tax=Limosilactobacillus vaginalis TaxID=1633 RepID=UPI003AAE0614
MVDSVFGNLDKEATKEAFKEYLKEWKKYKLKAMQRFPGLKSPSMDGQPNDGTPHDPDQKFVNHAEAEYQWRIRIKCCEALKTISEDEEVLGDILLHRFIKNESVTKTLRYINENYEPAMSERTFNDKQEEALWEGALMCPDDSVRIYKKDCGKSADNLR